MCQESHKWRSFWGSIVLFGLGVFMILVGIWPPTEWIALLGEALFSIGFVFAFTASLTATASLLDLYLPKQADTSIPSLPPGEFEPCILMVSRPAWCCLACQVVEKGADPGACLYCGEQRWFFRLHTEEDVNIALASL